MKFTIVLIMQLTVEKKAKKWENFHHRPQLFPSHYDSIHVKCSLVLVEEREKERETN